LGELAFFFRQQCEQNLPACLIGLAGEQASIVFDVELGDGPVQGGTSRYKVCNG
jgi:hypothetical protein